MLPLDAAGFSNVDFLTETEIRNWDLIRPIDFLTFDANLRVTDLSVIRSLDPTLLNQIEELTDIQFGGMTELTARKILVKVQMGVDQDGFFIEAGELITSDMKLDTDDQLSVTASGGSVEGRLFGDFVVSSYLASADSDNRFRIRKSDQSLLSQAELDAKLDNQLVPLVNGTVDLDLDFSILATIKNPLAAFNGNWQWDLSAVGPDYFENLSGFLLDSLLGSLSDQIGAGLNELASNSEQIASIVESIPFAGDSLATQLQGAVLQDLSFELDSATQQMLEDNGFTVTIYVTPQDFLDCILHQVPLPETLVEIVYANPLSDQSLPATASGSQSFGVGAASLDIQLGGQISGSADIDLGFVVGLDTIGGVYIEEANLLTASLSINGNFDGSAQIPGLVGVEVSASGILAANAAFKIDDGDGIPTERLYIFDGDLIPAPG